MLLLGVSLATFLLMCASPLDPLQTNVGQTALGSMSPEQVEKLEAYWGADTPVAERYLGWLGDVLHGDFGTSLLYRQPVIEVIGERLAGSVWLMLFAWVISGVLGVTLGVISGAFRGRWADRLIRGYCLLISGTPAFWLAILLLLVFAVWLGWFPIGLSVPVGMDAAAVTAADRLRHAVLPALTLSITGVANIALHTREKTIGAIAGAYNGMLENVFYNSANASATLTNGEVVAASAKTERELQSAATYSAFAPEIWNIVEGDYPTLIVQTDADA